MRTIVVTGGSEGMGRALVLKRAHAGDRVLAIGSNPEKGKLLLESAARNRVPGEVLFFRADLSQISEIDSALAWVNEKCELVDALCLFANRVVQRRVVTSDGLEGTFALYYLSRYLLSYGLTNLLNGSTSPIVVNVAGVGITRGSIHWRDLQLENGYSAVTAQLQAGRANDLLGVEYAKVNGDKIPYVLYHPGFTKSGDMSQMPKVIGGAIRAFAAIAAKPVIEAIEPIDGLIDCPPSVPLTAIDRGRPVRLDLPTLNLADAQRLTVVTEELVSTLRTQTAHIAPGPQKLVHDSPSNSDA